MYEVPVGSWGTKSNKNSFCLQKRLQPNGCTWHGVRIEKFLNTVSLKGLRWRHVAYITAEQKNIESEQRKVERLPGGGGT